MEALESHPAGFTKRSYRSRERGGVRGQRCQVGFGLLGLNASATARVISRFGLVYWGLTPHQQPGSYRGLIRFIGD